VNASAPIGATRRSTPAKLRVYEEEYAGCNWVVAGPLPQSRPLWPCTLGRAHAEACRRGFGVSGPSAQTAVGCWLRWRDQAIACSAWWVHRNQTGCAAVVALPGLWRPVAPRQRARQTHCVRGGIGVCAHTRPASVGRPRLQGDECLQKQLGVALHVTRCRHGSNQRFGLPRVDRCLIVCGAENSQQSNPESLSHEYTLPWPRALVCKQTFG